MPNLDDLDGGKSVQHVLVFGPPKVGKTQLLGTAASDFKIIYFDLEGGVETLLKLPQESRRNITLVSIRDTVDEPRALGTLDKVLKGGDFHICDGHGTVNCPYCTPNDAWTDIHVPRTKADGGTETIIMIDSLSQLTMSCNSAVNKLLGRVTTPEMIPERAKNWGDEWDAQGKYLNRILGTLQTAPYHVACTAHEIEAVREDDSKRIVPSIGTLNYAINSAKFFGHVIYMDKVNQQHVAYSDTGYSNRIVTGSRLDVALEGLDVMSLLPIFHGQAGAGYDNRKARATQMLQQTASAPTATSGTGNSLLDRFKTGG